MSSQGHTQQLNSICTGSTFIDIREFYGQEGDEKPGKKGITLSPEQVRPPGLHYSKF